MQRDYKIQIPPPTNLYDHWDVFRAIVNSPASDCDWRSCIMYFSENWVEKIHNDPAWLRIKMYLYEIGWSRFQYESNRTYYDICFSIIKNKRNLKLSPYLIDTASHLYSVSLGVAPGYSPAIDDDSLPASFLQQAFVESYDMSKYYPTIMKPSHFQFEIDEDPVFYSLQKPSTFTFSPKARKDSSAISELRELAHILRVFKEELLKDSNICSDTVLNDVSKGVEFEFFHNVDDSHGVAVDSKNLLEWDSRLESSHVVSKRGSCFASDAPFFRGSVGIRSLQN